MVKLIRHLICKHIRQFISGVTPIFSCGRHDLKVFAHITGNISYSFVLKGNYHNCPPAIPAAHIIHPASRIVAASDCASRSPLQSLITNF